jgi:hypothetical protein
MCCLYYAFHWYVHSAFSVLASERRSTVDVRGRPGYKIWRLFKFEFSEVNINSQCRVLMSWMTEVLMKTWKGAKFCNQACVERRPSNAVRKREKMRNAHISEMRSNIFRCRRFNTAWPVAKASCATALGTRHVIPENLCVWKPQKSVFCISWHQIWWKFLHLKIQDFVKHLIPFYNFIPSFETAIILFVQLHSWMNCFCSCWYIHNVNVTRIYIYEIIVTACGREKWSIQVCNEVISWMRILLIITVTSTASNEHISLSDMFSLCISGQYDFEWTSKPTWKWLGKDFLIWRSTRYSPKPTLRSNVLVVTACTGVTGNIIVFTKL